MRNGVSHVLVNLCFSLVAVQAQPATAPSQSVGPAESKSAVRPVNDKYALGPLPNFLQQQVFSSFQGNFSEPQGYNRDEKYLLPEQPADSSFAPVNETLAARTEASGNVGFVTTKGINFVLNGQIKYFSGSNDYFLIMRCCPARPSQFSSICVHMYTYYLSPVTTAKHFRLVNGQVAQMGEGNCHLCAGTT